MIRKLPLLNALGPSQWFDHNAWIIKLSCCLTLALLAFDTPLAASMANIEIVAADTTIKQETLHLDLTANIELPDNVRKALNKGVDLFFAADVKITNQRKWWPDKTSANLEIIRRISFHALTKKYVVNDLTFDKTSSFNDLSSALSALGNYRHIPLISQIIVDKFPDARILVRTRLIHRKLPLPLRMKRVFSPAWRLSSDWYTWSLN